ncbi:hypothetical protein BCR42DRAFT_414756 [Absidia repens]|uniref:RING-type domain-containing protein n=1 Tax=Absidia repens TaxID=90262 RepID=A0A1X2IGM2_9FUNG|nr:hypothetical protein BCR42DRAFT_414756 [Absidia repens]
MSDEPIDQTVKKKRSRVPARELHALVEDNNQRSSRNLPKCSLCQQRIEPRYWQLHYEYELGRLNEIDSDVYTNPSDKTKGKRGAAVLARQHMEKKHRKRPASVYEETLEKVKHNVSQRKDTLRRLDTPKHGDMEINDPPMLNDSQGQGEQTCFICNQQLFGDSDAINLHIDRCLMNINDTPPANSSSSSTNNVGNSQNGPGNNEWDEYEWAGQIRVRATSMMEGGYGDAGFATAKKEDDVDEDLDIEDDDVEYGHSQYNERDIMINSDDDNEDSSALREMVSGGGSTRVAQESDDEENDDSPQYQFEETVSDAGWNKHLMEHNNKSLDMPTSTTGNLVMDSLKSRIHELELASRSVPRCLICLEAYKTPLTSIVCWHVHCEKCWLQTLGSKKLCPQCQKITTPADLRRIYL